MSQLYNTSNYLSDFSLITPSKKDNTTCNKTGQEDVE